MIAQASQLKLSMGKLQTKKKEATIASFDAVEMYPSIKYKLVEKAVMYFARDLSSEIKGRINTYMPRDDKAQNGECPAHAR